MSKFRTHAIKVVEKFKKSSSKEIERLEALKEKSKRLHEHSDDHVVIREYFDRLAQKRRQLSDDVEWSTHFLDDLRKELKKKVDAPKGVAKSAKSRKKKTRLKAPGSPPTQES